MVVVKPYADQTIWGGSRLADCSEEYRDHIGHLYSPYCNGVWSNQILNGPYTGKTVTEYFEDKKEEYGFGEYQYFPLVIALVDAKENLSIQVHPDDATSCLLTNGTRLGKSESWYFLSAPDSGTIYAGCNCGSLEELKESILSGRVEDVTTRLPVKEGDYVFVPAGTLHAMSAGSLVFEIEENAGNTYRFYDFDRIDAEGRKRELHIPQAFLSVKIENKICARRYEDSPIEEQRYSTRHLKNINQYTNTSDTLQVLTLIEGKGIIDGAEVSKGYSVILEPKETVIAEIEDAMISQPKRRKR